MTTNQDNATPPPLNPASPPREPLIMAKPPKPAWFLRRWAWALTGGVNQNLLSAAALGQTRKVMKLLDSGAHLEFRDRDGWTALMFAAGGGHAATVAALLARGADPNARRSDGSTALNAAIDLHRAAVVKILQNAGGTAQTPPRTTPPPVNS
jgi:ankyrin repeat protein